MAGNTDWIDQNVVLAKLPTAQGAEFDSYMDQHENECLSSTGTELLQQVLECASLPQSKSIF
jgi:hypothetical protein